MDELEFFKKNLVRSVRRSTRRLNLAADLIDWKSGVPRGDQADVVRHGLGLSIHTWGGGGHDSNVQCTINPDGAVEIACGTQDLGVGTRTALAIVAAETLGIPLDKVKVSIGDSRLPPSGGSGGSTTIGGISSASRDACVQAANALFEKVAPELGGDPKKLVAKGGKVYASDNEAKAIPWDVACRSVGAQPLVTNGKTQRSLMQQGVGGAQAAEVEVDVETGIVRVLKLVAVQDCGRIIDLLGRSRVRGADHGRVRALYEERIMDQSQHLLARPRVLQARGHRRRRRARRPHDGDVRAPAPRRDRDRRAAGRLADGGDQQRGRERDRQARRALSHNARPRARGAAEEGGVT
jgi:xanthine dehydrogenase YagR molybdenum-binding subunit